MRKLTYYAVFEPTNDGAFGVYWPDLPGCTSYGNDFEHALNMATEALGVHIHSMEHDGDEVPQVSMPPFDEMPKDAIVVPVTIFPDIVNNIEDNRSVKTNITLPFWLREWANVSNINLSQTLQTTLRKMHREKDFDRSQSNGSCISESDYKVEQSLSVGESVVNYDPAVNK